MQSLAIGKEVVDNKHLVIWPEPLLAHYQRHFLLISIGEYLASVKAALNVVAFGLFCEYHRHAELLGTYGGKRYAARLDCYNRGYSAQIKKPTKFFSHFPHQLNVYAVVQKSVDLDDVAGQNLALFLDALLKYIHGEYISYQK